VTRGLTECLEEIDLTRDGLGRAASPTRHATLVVRGGYSQVLLEVICEVALVGEASHERRHRWNRTFGEKLACSFYTHLDQIVVWRQTGRLAECELDPTRAPDGVHLASDVCVESLNATPTPN